MRYSYLPVRRPRLRPLVSAPPKVGFVSLGCPKALVDSERILTRLRAEGYDVVGTYEDANLVVVNTCGFIDEAVHESLDAIGEALARNGKVIVTGCLGAKPRNDHRPPSERAQGHRAARLRGSRERRARTAAAAARSVRRPRAAAGHPPHAAALRVPEDLRGLQPPLQLLHHPVDARRPREPSDRRRDARGRAPGARPASRSCS